MKRAVCYVLLLVFSTVLVYAGWNYFHIRRDYEEGRDSYVALEEYLTPVVGRTEDLESEELCQGSETSVEYREDAELDSEEAEATEKPGFRAPFIVDFAGLSKINPDIVGWIYIEGTSINYPIVQGEDNKYYLKHLFDGTYNLSGSVFLDVDCDADFGETNNVVYGHFMWDGSMFHDIRSYRDPAFFAAHPKGVLITPEKAYEIVFFSGYVSDTLAGAWDIHFSQEGYEDWLSELIEKSVFDAGVDVSGEDRVLTLSTCSYEFTEARFVLHGKILEDE